MLNYNISAFLVLLLDTLSFEKHTAGTLTKYCMSQFSLFSQVAVYVSMIQHISHLFLIAL